MPRSKRIIGPLQVATGPTTQYTAPTGIRAKIRRIHVNNPSGSPVTFTLTIGADAAATRLFDAYSVAAGGQLDVYGPFTVEPAEIVTTSAGTNNVLTLTVDADLDAN